MVSNRISVCNKSEPMASLAKKLALTLLPNSVLAELKKVHYARILRRMSESEEPDLIVLKHLVEPGQCVADVGANIGVYTKYLSDCVGPSGQVISIEPVPMTFDVLRSNIRKLGLKNVALRNYAVSDTAGQVRMEVPKYEFGGENFYEARVQSETAVDSPRSFVVPATTLDALLSTIPVVHFIKCDVEGHELHCIRGAMKTIEKSRPAWLIELSGDLNDRASTGHQTLRILRNLGYGAFWVDGAKMRAWSAKVSSVNFFFLTNLHLEVLRERGFCVEGSC